MNPTLTSLYRDDPVRSIDNSSRSASSITLLLFFFLLLSLHGDATYDQVNSALNLPGLAGAYATTPVFAIDTMSFTIAMWIRIESCINENYYIYSYWYMAHLFSFQLQWLSSSCVLSFAARAKICNPTCDILYVKSK